jgi:uncharacterized protein (DUF924 family)
MVLLPEDVLDFWFEQAGPKAWFAVDAAFDARVRRILGPACHGFLQTRSVIDHPWMVEPESALALVIVLDQAPRNVWRGSNAAFKLDPLAREAAMAMLDAGFDWALPKERRAFVYLPFSHSEDIEDQALAVLMCEERLGADSENTRHARAHMDVIARFGRFPHRNAVLGRTPRAEEVRFLEEGGYAPGLKRSAKTSQGQS